MRHEIYKFHGVSIAYILATYKCGLVRKLRIQILMNLGFENIRQTKLTKMEFNCYDFNNANYSFY